MPNLVSQNHNSNAAFSFEDFQCCSESQLRSSAAFYDVPIETLKRIVARFGYEDFAIGEPNLHEYYAEVITNYVKAHCICLTEF